jgi:hypothetical protein
VEDENEDEDEDEDEDARGARDLSSISVGIIGLEGGASKSITEWKPP